MCNTKTKISSTDISAVSQIPIDEVACKKVKLIRISAS
jgi:hypothetical protein